MEWTKKQYNEQYEKWVPWLEDLYLRYFTKDNKASYATRDTLNKTKVTGIEGVNNLVTGQIGQGGLGQGVGDIASREGINRGERMGKDDKGGYIPEAAGPVATGGNAVIGGVSQTGQQAAGAAKGGLQSVGGALGFGGQKK
ncbi:hypothetical protein QBC34DRAFT_384670 [Podospora aff. communis PSN243]|uniref:Uncharacterized protein n=1 Tax=Podospora aff. communis PSN243 TaxID=3040156 RepID=A0AAV9GCJ8_9PEZI|nr:hypothetical protein QBC34DRAFT_384670 [Podospora aff. communis PSN243]